MTRQHDSRACRPRHRAGLDAAFWTGGRGGDYTGSLAAHASLAAREYGIPAVVGTGYATVRLRNGQQVTVDGSAGVVEV